MTFRSEEMRKALNKSKLILLKTRCSFFEGLGTNGGAVQTE